MTRLIIISFLLFSCNSEIEQRQRLFKKENKYISLKDTLYMPFDTAEVIKMLNIQYSKNTNTTFNNLDTLTLKYTNYACECPKWIIKDKFYLETSKEKYNASFYLEPIADNIKIDSRICTFENEIQVIGKLKTTKGIPSNSDSTIFSLPGNVFTYYSYKVLFPLTVYGPLYHSEKSEIPNDSNELMISSKINITTEN